MLHCRDEHLLIDILCTQQSAAIDSIKSVYSSIAVDHILEEGE